MSPKSTYSFCSVKQTPPLGPKHKTTIHFQSSPKKNESSGQLHLLETYFPPTYSFDMMVFAWHELFLSLKHRNNLHSHQYHLQPLSPAMCLATTFPSANLTGIKCYHITTLVCISLESNPAKSIAFNRECCSRNIVE